MSTQRRVIISDTSCLILLDKINVLDLLHKLFGEITITSSIATEYKKKIPKWITVADPQNKTYQTILVASLDAGEASTLALALEQKDCLLIIDDLKGRKFAEKLDLAVTGTIGVLLDAKLSGHIKAVKPLLQKIKSTNFRISMELEKRIVEIAGE
jgi:predicted nucleic acid-binding protein